MATVFHRYVGRDGKIPKPSTEEKNKQSADRQFAEARARQTEAKAQLAEMEARRRSGELIERSEAIRQASFLCVSLQRRMLALAGTLPRKLVGKGTHEMKTIIDGAIRECLTELSELPNVITRSDYDRFVEDLA
jgi:phage terminase Nu1 subunit (DNA packaging protein)